MISKQLLAKEEYSNNPLPLDVKDKNPGYSRWIKRTIINSGLLLLNHVRQIAQTPLEQTQHTQNSHHNLRHPHLHSTQKQNKTRLTHHRNNNLRDLHACRINGYLWAPSIVYQTIERLGSLRKQRFTRRTKKDSNRQRLSKQRKKDHLNALSK